MCTIIVKFLLQKDVKPSYEAFDDICYGTGEDRQRKYFFNFITKWYTSPLVKSVYQIFFLISQPKHMLWVLKRTVLMRRFF